MIIWKLWKRQWEKKTSAMIRIRIKGKTYLTKTLKDMTNLIRKRKILSFIRTLGITTGDIKGIIIKNLSHWIPKKKKGNHPPPLIKILGRGNH